MCEIFTKLARYFTRIFVNSLSNVAFLFEIFRAIILQKTSQQLLLIQVQEYVVNTETPSKFTHPTHL